MGKIIYWYPPDRVLLEAIRTRCPEYYDKALEASMRDKE